MERFNFRRRSVDEKRRSKELREAFATVATTVQKEEMKPRENANAHRVSFAVERRTLSQYPKEKIELLLKYINIRLVIHNLEKARAGSIIMSPLELSFQQVVVVDNILMDKSEFGIIKALDIRYLTDAQFDRCLTIIKECIVEVLRIDMTEIDPILDRIRAYRSLVKSSLSTVDE